LLANSVDKLKVPGKALYSCMLNAQGGVIDDLIVYYLGDSFYRVVVNAATREKDLAWMNEQAKPFELRLVERADLAMVAVQGPNARHKTLSLLSPDAAERAGALGKFVACEADGLFIARTGYTGEDGFEIIVPEDQAIALWQRLLAAGVRPCGLGARDTLRLEAGMALYGQDMDETVSPYEAGLAWTVALDEGRDFIGRAALEQQLADGSARQMVGIVMDEKGVLRHGQSVFAQCGQGEILSGTFSPTLSKAVALARIPAGQAGAVEVDIRGRRHPVRVVKYPFVRDGKAQAGI
jgi:aminomethyltransferase